MSEKKDIKQLLIEYNEIHASKKMVSSAKFQKSLIDSVKDIISKTSQELGEVAKVYGQNRTSIQLIMNEYANQIYQMSDQYAKQRNLCESQKNEAFIEEMKSRIALLNLVNDKKKIMQDPNYQEDKKNMDQVIRRLRKAEKIKESGNKEDKQKAESDIPKLRAKLKELKSGDRLVICQNNINSNIEKIANLSYKRQNIDERLIQECTETLAQYSNEAKEKRMITLRKQNQNAFQKMVGSVLIKFTGKRKFMKNFVKPIKEKIENMKDNFFVFKQKMDNETLIELANYYVSKQSLEPCAELANTSEMAKNALKNYKPNNMKNSILGVKQNTEKYINKAYEEETKETKAKTKSVKKNIKGEDIEK